MEITEGQIMYKQPMCQQVCYYKYLWYKSTMRENEISASMVKKSLKGGIYFVFW